MRSHLVSRAKDLRKNATDTEAFLWRHLRSTQFGGFKFRRQHPIRNFIVDFVCLEKRLVIELDGGQHAEEREEERDRARDTWLKKEGYKVLRFWDNEVFTNLEGVLEVIQEKLHSSPSPKPLPSQGGASVSQRRGSIAGRRAGLR